MNSFNDSPQSIQNNVFDLQSLRRLTGATADKNEALQKAAEQFEGIFVRQLLSSMRKVNDVFSKDGLFDSSSSDFYQGMWDDQIASDISAGNSSSISAMLVQQLGGSSKQQFHNSYSSAIQTEKNAAIITNDHSQKLVANSIERPDNELFENTVSAAINVNASEKITEPESFATREEFIDYLLPFAKQAAERLGASPKALLAQAALETGWGKHFVTTADDSSSKNLFNIKDKADWQGDVAIKKSLEFDGDKFDLKKAGFRVYESFRESFDDFVDFLSNRERYNSVVENAAEPEKYFTQLQKSGYATDPEYASKIQKIFNSELLQKIVD